MMAVSSAMTNAVSSAMTTATTAMTSGDIWLTIFLMGVATVFTRCLMFLLGSRVQLPVRLQHALRYAPAAALAAIVVPDLVLTGGPPVFAGLNAKVLAGAATVAFYLATRHLLATIIAGMAVFAGIRFLI
ncbi:MAG: AzlD protein [Herminiimonas sp.]|nr:AzlD protein [Herminiimonas sp.]MDB5855666.1 AzlD protein [Herminiimonas sp.]